MIILGLVIEKIFCETLESIAQEQIFQPLGMIDTLYNPPERARERCAATERCKWRGRIVWGEVHDENAYALGGVAGHAGLFSTVEDLARFCQMILCGGLLDGVQLLSPSTVGKLGRPATKLRGADQGFGWRLKGDPEGPAGDQFSLNAFGHTGFTGTSIWFDPQRKIASILLTNRVHPSRENEHIHQLRRDFNDAVIRACEG